MSQSTLVDSSVPCPDESAKKKKERDDFLISLGFCRRTGYKECNYGDPGAKWDADKGGYYTEELTAYDVSDEVFEKIKLWAADSQSEDGKHSKKIRVKKTVNKTRKSDSGQSGLKSQWQSFDTVTKVLLIALPVVFLVITICLGSLWWVLLIWAPVYFFSSVLNGGK